MYCLTMTECVGEGEEEREIVRDRKGRRDGERERGEWERERDTIIEIS